MNMSQIEIRQVTARRPRRLAAAVAGRTCASTTPNCRTQSRHSTWQRMLDPNEPTHAALAWADGKAVGMVHFIYHRSNWSDRKLLLPAGPAGRRHKPVAPASAAS
jgi:hypothetical protein